jgi:Na+/H+ antiporter NhaD/arsenite permease-like protein
VGIVGLFGGIWWLLSQPTEGGHGPAFFISTSIFLLVFAAISLRWMHETAAALLGAAAVWLVHYIGGTYFPALHIIDFEESMAFVDWNVIWLIMGMMIFMAMFSETGAINWVAFRTFRLVIPEVLASNIGGAATIIGDPPSTIVGSHLGLSFVEYLVNMAPIATLCMIPLLLIISFLYRRELAGAEEQFSPALVAQLEADSHITDVPLLRKAGLVGLLMMILFFTGDYFGGIPPSVIALSGAAILVAWVRPDMHRMLREVNWTTLIFFIGIFIIVGGLEATGVIAWIAEIIGDLAGDSLARATVLMVWIPGVASGIVDNIPFTVAALPIADYLTATIPGAENGVLYWALILGADLGGNATILGSAPNIVAVGLLGSAGYRLSFGRFMRDGVPVAIATLLLATVWLLFRY